MPGIVDRCSRPWILFVLIVHLASTVVLCTCPLEWQGINGACFKVYNTKKKWSEANQTCTEAKQGAHLIYFDNERPLTFVNYLDDIKNGLQYFVGAQKLSGVWVWGNGDNVHVPISSLLSTRSGKYALFNKWDLRWEATGENHESAFICELSETPIPGTSVMSTFKAGVTTSSLAVFSLSTASLIPSSSKTTSSISPPLSSSSSSSTSLMTPTSTSTSFASFSKSYSPTPDLSTLSSSSSASSSSSSTSLMTPTSTSFVSFSQSYSPIQEISSSSSSFSNSIALPSVSLSTTLTLPSVSLSTSANQKERGKNESQPLDNNPVIVAATVSLYIQNISKLDVRQRSSLKESVDMIQNMLVAMETSTYNSANQRPLLASQRLEEFALRYMEYHSNEKEILIKRNNVMLQAKMLIPPESNDYLFETNDGTQQETMILLPKENFVENETSVVSIYYSNLADIMNKQEYIFRSNRYKVRSKILSTSIQPKKSKLVQNATIGFKIPVSDLRLQRKCVFWDFGVENVEDPGWSDEGCTLVRSTDRYVDCSCNHLTHFAVLMQVKDDQLSSDHQDILTILTYLGLTASIIGCILTFVAYFLFTDVKSEQSQIRMNLVFVLAVAHILFLLGSPARGHLILCVSVAVLLQLFYTSALCWMFAEGIQLYMQVVKVFNTNLKMRQVYGFAWGFPLFLIVLSLSIAASDHRGLASFVNEEFCWLSTEIHLIWLFIVPVLLLILGNIVVLGLVLKEIKNITKPLGTSQHENSLRSSFKAFVVLAPLLGITWIVGLLCVLGAGVAGLYIFTILNSTQGFFIFLFHCLRNSEIRSKLHRKIQAFDDSFLKQDSSIPDYRRPKSQHPINTKTSTKPSTPETVDSYNLNVPQENIALSEIDFSDEHDGENHNELKLRNKK